MSNERNSKSERGTLNPNPQTEQAPSKPWEGAGMCWGGGSSPGRRAQGDRLDIRSCDQMWALLAQWMFYEAPGLGQAGSQTEDPGEQGLACP